MTAACIDTDYLPKLSILLHCCEQHSLLSSSQIVLQAPKGSSQPKTGRQQVKAMPEASKGVAAVEGEVPIMMPAKLATNKVAPTSASTHLTLVAPPRRGMNSHPAGEFTDG